MERLMCGAAIGDITPKNEELDGLEALQRRKFGGIIDPLSVRAISLRSGDTRLLLVCFELDKAPYPFAYIREISDRFDIPEDNIIFTAVHCHAVPVTGDRIYDGPNNIAGKPDFVKDTTHRYEARIHDIVMDTIRRAVEGEQPAILHAGHGESYINLDRRCLYAFTDEDGQDHELIALGQDRSAPVDRIVSVLRFDSSIPGCREPIAVLVNYPVHCTVMHANSALNGKVGITSDIAGEVSRLMERRYPGTVCMWTSGAAGNINPAMQCELTYPDPVTGRPNQEMMPGDTTAMLRNIAMQHFADVFRTVEAAGGEDSADQTAEGRPDGPSPIHPSERTDCSGPSADSPSVLPVGSRVCLCRSEGIHSPYEVRLHMLRIGNTAVLTASGELFSSYTEALSSVIPREHLIVMNHDCSVAFPCGYIPDEESLRTGECWLPGVGKDHNIIPERFKEQFLADTEKMYRELFDTASPS